MPTAVAFSHAQRLTKYDFHQSSKDSDQRRTAAMPRAMQPLASRLSPLFALSLLPLLAACQIEAQSADAKPERPVQVQRVAFEPADVNREFVGVVRARYETDLGFRVAGKIVARTVNVGDRVRAGDVVARLDAEDFKLQVESARAELSAATSNLAQTAADELRYRTLRERGYAAVADYERKKSAKDEADGRLERAQRALDLARNQVAYAELKADADGVITATMAEPGQVVAIGQGVVRLAHRGEKEALVALPETWLGEARKSVASIRLWSDPKRKFTAQLRELSPQADAATRTYAARFSIADPNDLVALGMTAIVTLSHASDDDVAKLPLSAIINRGNGPSVYVVETDGALNLQPVTLASFTEDTALVTGGVQDGDKVVTLGVQKLVAGQRVRAIDAR
jgi:RND family efflux transporter MFP subunit